MSQNKASIKWKIFIYLSLFVLFIIILLWLFQIVFLGSFYKMIKVKEIYSTADKIVKSIDKEGYNFEIQDYLESISSCGMISSIDNKIKFSYKFSKSCLLHEMNNSYFNYFVYSAKNNNGSYLEILPEDPYLGINASIVLTRMIKILGQDYVLMINSTIKPVDATVNTITVQLYILTFVLVISAFFLAFFISKKISTPIIKINNISKQLALGNYNVCFEGSSYREISELAETLNYAAKELNKVENLRRELIANISHDLRTPLTMITGYSELIRDFPSESTPDNIQVIIDESNRLSTLVNDILDLSKLQTGNISFNFSNINLTDIILGIVYRYIKLTEKNGYKIDFIFDNDVYIYSDEVRISQVVYNLLNNAVTYTGENKYVKIIQVIEDNFVTIKVIDEGEGIVFEKLKDIWDRYYKIDKSHKRAQVGTGLGLSIVKSILESHGAEYGVFSEVNKGSEFWFKIKIVDKVED